MHVAQAEQLIGKAAEKAGVNVGRQFCCVLYDVPQHSKVGNTSGLFRRIGARVNLSCWVVPVALVPHAYLDKMRSLGCKVEVIRYDVSEESNIVRMAREAIEAEVRRIRDSVADTMAAVAERIAKYKDNIDETEKAERLGEGAWCKAKKLLDDAQDAAMAFDILRDMQELLAAQRQAVASESEAYYAEHGRRARDERRRAEEMVRVTQQSLAV